MRLLELGLQFSAVATVTAQNRPTASASGADSTASTTTTDNSLGVLSLITPPVKLSDVQASDSSKFVSDASSFHASYSSADDFQFWLYWQDYIYSIDIHSESSRRSRVNADYVAYYSNMNGLLNDPTACLSNMRSLVTIYPYSIQSSILSQATEMLSGYMSLATKDVLKQNVTVSQITPGATVDIGLASPTSVARAVPAATADTKVLVAAAGAAAGVCGAVLFL